MIKNKKVLVTGASGFIGANLVRRLIQDGAEVFVLVRKNSNLWRLNDILKKIHTHVGDLTDFKNIKKIISDVKPDGIFHLGATTIMSGVISEPDKVAAVNVLGTKNLLVAFEGIDYDFFMNTSTFTEDEKDDYAKSKKMASEFCVNYAKQNKKPIVTLRLFTPYGPFIQKGRLIFNVLTKAMRNEDIEMTSPEIARDFIYVDDLVDLYISAALHAKANIGEVFNAGSGVEITLKEVIDSAIKITGSKSTVKWGARPVVSYDSNAVNAGISQTISRLGWSPKTSFFEGMKKTYEWLKQNLNSY